MQQLIHRLTHLGAPKHCGRAMVWNTWRACWMCANTKCSATA